MTIAYELLPRPDWAGTTTVAIAPDLEASPRAWAQAIFDPRSVPNWVKALYVGRMVVAAVLHLAPGDRSMLAVDRVVGDEAVIDTDDRHLRFVATVRQEPGLVHMTTLVRLKGLRGRVYFAPVRLLHDAVTRSMMVAAASRLSP
jgi:hypothetical protein